jgi:ribosome recycling factor
MIEGIRVYTNSEMERGIRINSGTKRGIRIQVIPLTHETRDELKRGIRTKTNRKKLIGTPLLWRTER